MEMALSHGGWWAPLQLFSLELSWGGAFLSLIDGLCQFLASPHSQLCGGGQGRYEVCLVPWLAGHWEVSWVHDPPFPAHSASI